MKYVPALSPAAAMLSFAASSLMVHVADFREFMQLERSGPAVHGVSGHKQRLQLLIGVCSVLVDLRQAVVDAAANVGGQCGE
jgi:hypothetical protein